VIVLDAFALIAALGNEPARVDVEQLLVAEDELVAMSAVNLAEVVDVLYRVHGRPFDEIEGALTDLVSAGLLILPAGDIVAIGAGRSRAEHYERQRAPLSLADAFALVTASRTGASLATADPVLASVARAVDVPVVALPDSRGQRPDV
jgi:PIN domain nuclease of toxin-antitoxin system